MIISEVKKSIIVLLFQRRCRSQWPPIRTWNLFLYWTIWGNFLCHFFRRQLQLVNHFRTIAALVLPKNRPTYKRQPSFQFSLPESSVHALTVHISITSGWRLWSTLHAKHTLSCSGTHVFQWWNKYLKSLHTYILGSGNLQRQSVTMHVVPNAYARKRYFKWFGTDGRKYSIL